MTKIITGYVVSILLWLLLRLIFFDQLWPLALANTVAEYLFVPLPGLLIASLWPVRWPALAQLSLPLIIFGLLFGPLFWPPPRRPIEVEDERLITVMSFNLLARNRSYQAIAATIQAAGPDLVGLQELRPHSAQELVARLEADYPYHTLQPLAPGRSAGLLSRYPIEQVEWFALPPLDIALHATVRIEGEPVHVLVVHLSPNNFFDHPASEFIPLVKERYGRRAAETRRLQQKIKGLTGPVLLMCDCNMTDTSEAYARLTTVLQDSFRQAGWGFGHTFQPAIAPFPIQRIDYVWHSEAFQPVRAYVGQDGGSDHLPVVAQFRLEQRRKIGR